MGLLVYLGLYHGTWEDTKEWRVAVNLYNQGYFVLSGKKYGADFLIYEGKGFRRSPRPEPCQGDDFSAGKRFDYN